MAAHIEILNRLLTGKAVAIVRLDSGAELVSVARALKAGGIDAIEFTMTIPGVAHMIEAATREFGDEILLGAGTVLDAESARAAILAGAEFVVTPALNVATIELCRRYGKPVIPGALTPTEILTAWQAGADIVKVFPADSFGPAYIKAVLAPLPQLRLAPTGGVSADNAADYLKVGAVAVGVGGKLVDKSAVKRGDWAAITVEARRLTAAVS